MSDIYLYDEIVGEKWVDYDGKECGFTPNDLAEALRDADDTVSLYVNSPGGSVFAAVAMTSEIKRAISKGITVNAYVDGIAASAASFLIMACSNVYMYDGTMLMVHKPMSFCFGNADDMLKCAEDLENIQDATCMPMYRSKLKGDEEELRALIANETWLSATKAAEMFDISIINEHKEPKQKKELLAKFGYKNVPKELTTPVDYSDLEERINKLGGEQ